MTSLYIIYEISCDVYKYVYISIYIQNLIHKYEIFLNDDGTDTCTMTSIYIIYETPYDIKNSTDIWYITLSVVEKNM